MVNLKKIDVTVREPCNGHMVINTQEIGLMINVQDAEHSAGLTRVPTREIGMRVNVKDKVCLLGQMGLALKVAGSKTSEKAMEYSRHQMALST